MYTSRPNKRKQPHPLKSPTSHGIKMSFTDHYKENPQAYSRAIQLLNKPKKKPKPHHWKQLLLSQSMEEKEEQEKEKEEEPKHTRTGSDLSVSSEITLTDDILDDEVTLLKPNVAKCTTRWAKAPPMNISQCQYYDLLAPAERECCSILRLLPEQYLTIKATLIRAGREWPRGTFKKRDAQKLCRIDVNKTSKVFEWFVKINWLPEI